MASLKLSLAWILFVYIICITSVLVMADSSNGNDFIDPLDPLNFDPINMRMKLKDKVGFSISITSFYRSDVVFFLD